ncbi:hypothetical protein MNEG_5882 [Monoraphidium neglectum]|uniref:Chloride channel protein n=1 Tax=Monoraphidium neglectum TaxID=145388 RepID=A0A0D2MNH0_9CHLO|nr:hypothetical protein MNEG_5882 [Monoraphidium neglectum]KIZ02077.1 hypothetical protein MNEG_5882 [Monoraphidium neglectum]|eukprot:XP_013901096.1 hypothetical protein MNEG_5882 [Monoraphidium neglectum]
MAFCLNWATEALQWAKYAAAVSLIQSDGGYFLPWLAYTGISTAYAALAGLLISRLSPMAAGSGIPAMRSWINGVDVPRCVAPSTLAVKAVGVALAIAAGLVAGKEGPYIQCGGIISYLVGCSADACIRRWAVRRFRHEKTKPGKPAPVRGPRRWLRGWLRAALRALAVVEPREASDYASVGTSGGVAVAFNAPVAGMAYAAEEGNTVYSVAMLWKAVFAAGAAIWMMQLLGVAAQGQSLLVDSQITLLNNLSFRGPSEVSSIFWYHSWEVPLMALLGGAIGLLGALWTSACIAILKWRASWIPESRPGLRNLEVAVCAAVTATVWFTVCYASPCIPIPPSAAAVTAANGHHFTRDYFNGPGSLWPRLWCREPGTYASWAQLFAMPIEGAVRALMSVQPAAAVAGDGGGLAVVPSENFVFTYSTLGLFVACAFTGLLLTYGIAAPTGIFIPTMAIGAAVGRLAGHGVQAVLLAAGLQLQVSLPTWAAVGAAGLLAGNTRLLLSTVLIVTETTGSAPALVPIILATVVSKLVADALTK